MKTKNVHLSNQKFIKLLIVLLAIVATASIIFGAASAHEADESANSGETTEGMVAVDVALPEESAPADPDAPDPAPAPDPTPSSDNSSDDPQATALKTVVKFADGAPEEASIDWESKEVTDQLDDSYHWTIKKESSDSYNIEFSNGSNTVTHEIYTGDQKYGIKSWVDQEGKEIGNEGNLTEDKTFIINIEEITEVKVTFNVDPEDKSWGAVYDSEDNLVTDPITFKPGEEWRIEDNVIIFSHQAEGEIVTTEYTAKASSSGKLQYFHNVNVPDDESGTIHYNDTVFEAKFVSADTQILNFYMAPKEENGSGLPTYFAVDDKVEKKELTGFSGQYLATKDGFKYDFVKDPKDGSAHIFKLHWTDAEDNKTKSLEVRSFSDYGVYLDNFYFDETAATEGENNSLPEGIYRFNVDAKNKDQSTCRICAQVCPSKPDLKYVLQPIDLFSEASAEFVARAQYVDDNWLSWIDVNKNSENLQVRYILLGASTGFQGVGKEELQSNMNVILCDINSGGDPLINFEKGDHQVNYDITTFTTGLRIKTTHEVCDTYKETFWTPTDFKSEGNKLMMDELTGGYYEIIANPENGYEVDYWDIKEGTDPKPASNSLNQRYEPGTSDLTITPHFKQVSAQPGEDSSAAQTSDYTLAIVLIIASVAVLSTVGVCVYRRKFNK